MNGSVSWPDTTQRMSPQGYGAEPIAIWLLGRHRHLAALLTRVDCVARAPVVEIDEDEEPLPFDDWQWRPDLEALADDLRVYDSWDRGEPVDPGMSSMSRRAKVLASMTTNERCQLRLLATLNDRGPEISLAGTGLYALDDAGRRLLVDWLDALRAEWAEPRWRETGPTP